MCSVGGDEVDDYHVIGILFPIHFPHFGCQVRPVFDMEGKSPILTFIQSR